MKLPLSAFIEVCTAGSQDRRTVSRFEMFYFQLLDPEILSAESSILRPLKILHYFAKNLRMYRIVVRIYGNILFRAAGS